MPVSLDRPGIVAANALRIEQGHPRPTQEQLADEVAVALVYNGISHAVMMCTPCDLEDFALGFSLSEGILNRAGELHDLEIRETAQGITVEMQIAEPRFLALKSQRRAMTGRTGCGLCGVESLDAAMRPTPQIESRQQVDVADISAAIALLSQHQALNAATGAVHAAGFWQNGQLLVREDVGRHNALDKLIGATARQASRDGLLLMTSRASYEIVQKAATAGFAIVAAISAPTALAVRLAEAAGITLIGFARETRMTVYTQAWRVNGCAVAAPK